MAEAEGDVGAAVVEVEVEAQAALEEKGARNRNGSPCCHSLLELFIGPHDGRSAQVSSTRMRNLTTENFHVLEMCIVEFEPLSDSSAVGGPVRALR